VALGFAGMERIVEAREQHADQASALTPVPPERRAG
jgi:hypothetical protein